jgi:predicted metal-dependent hydrolase
VKIPYRIVFRSNQKYIRLKISLDHELVISAPVGANMSKVNQFVQAKQGWILKSFQKLIEKKEVFNPLKQIPFLGIKTNVRVEKRPVEKKRSRVKVDDQGILIQVDKETKKEVLALLKKWLIKEAKKYIEDRMILLSEKVGVSFSRITVRDQKSRWGSSSGKGTLSFNWRIIMTPSSVVDYLLFHELAHQVHRNHSHQFWRQVKSWCPEYKELDYWLKKNSYLMAILR